MEWQGQFRQERTSVHVILARDRGLALAKQILIYPMLDDRLRPLYPEVARVSVVSEDFLATCWGALRDGFRENEGVLAVAAPARQPDLAHLAPAYVEVGDLDNGAANPSVFRAH